MDFKENLKVLKGDFSCSVFLGTVDFVKKSTGQQVFGNL